MRYVLDASTAVRWVRPTPLQAKALELSGEYQRNIHELIAPAHFPGEIASALTKAERQKLIASGDAHLLFQEVLNTPPALYPIDPLFYRAVEIASRTRSGFYDCLYVALAEQEKCDLVTADDKLIKALQGQHPFLMSLATLP
jgi:predicted nucleic acid-binding protein